MELQKNHIYYQYLFHQTRKTTLSHTLHTFEALDCAWCQHRLLSPLLNRIEPQPRWATHSLSSAFKHVGISASATPHSFFLSCNATSISHTFWSYTIAFLAESRISWGQGKLHAPSAETDVHSSPVYFVLFYFHYRDLNYWGLFAVRIMYYMYSVRPLGRSTLYVHNDMEINLLFHACVCSATMEFVTHGQPVEDGESRLKCNI